MSRWMLFSYEWESQESDTGLLIPELGPLATTGKPLQSG